MKRPGALVISLDFELHWGVRDRPLERYRPNLLGARQAVPRMLELFEKYEIAATWAVVGFLFASSRHELESYCPKVRPKYRNEQLSPYGQEVGGDEQNDPLHFAPSLIRLIQQTPRQEIGTHTFSHYYCAEEGQTREAFSADLACARAIAEQWGVRPRSIVFPRNQHNPDYDAVLIEHGIRTYRGNPKNWMWGDGQLSTPPKRVGRLIDAYINVGGHATTPWEQVMQTSGLSNVPASCPLRPCRNMNGFMEKLRLVRLCQRVRFAAQRGEIFHLWWHPHTIGVHLDENLAFLECVLKEFQRCRDEYGMDSLSMLEVDEIVRNKPSLGGEPLRDQAPALQRAIAQ